MNQQLSQPVSQSPSQSVSELVKKPLVETATMPIAIVGDSGTVVSASPAWKRLFAGEVPEELLTAAREGDGHQVDVCVGARGEESRWLRLQATPLAGGESGAVLVVATDVTKVHSELADLKDRIGFMEWQALSLSTFTKVMSSAPLVLFSMDPSGMTTMSDGKGLELVGGRPGERVGTNELEASEGTPTHEHLTRALAGETLRVLVEPAKGVFFDTWYMPQRDESDRLDGVLGLSIDATDRVLSERRLAEKVEVIEQQTATIRDLAAPILKVWKEVLCMPIIGSVDAARASDMMERLLEAIVREKARFAILDLTGVEVMDTPTVHHMLRIFAAARTVGVEGVLSGVRPAVAQSVVSLGVDISGLRMVRTLHDALGWCLERTPKGR
jgi:rsbT co-antagonist protein RsbR